MTEDLKKPTKGPIGSDAVVCTRLIDWDNNYHQILVWFRDTTIPSISTLFGNFDDCKSTWDMLTYRYLFVGGSQEYKLILDIYHLKQKSG